MCSICVRVVSSWSFLRSNFIEKDIDYDGHGLGHFANFFVALHDFFDSSLQVNKSFVSLFFSIQNEKLNCAK